MFGFNCRVTRKLCGYERRAVEGLLERSGLVFEGSPDYTAVAEDCDENIVATASLSGSVIKMVAADPRRPRGRPLSPFCLYKARDGGAFRRSRLP